MRKLFFFVLTGLMMTLGACQQEDETLMGPSSSQTLTVTIPQGINTRAVPGDGSLINRCILEIYHNNNGNYELYQNRRVEKVTGNTATFADLRLVTSQSYKLVLWADCADASQNDLYYKTDDLSNITVNEGNKKYTGNDDGFDAFFATKEITVQSTFAESITLKRPFGQINVQTNDLGTITSNDLKPDSVEVTFTSIPSSFNVLEGVAGTPVQNYTYTAAIKDAASGTLTIDYIWAAPEQEELADFSMKFLNASGTEITSNESFTNIPVRRNYRTNISGNLLTKKGEVEVTVDPIFDGDLAAVIDGAKNITTSAEYSSLQEAIDAADDNDEIHIWGTLDEDITLNKDLVIMGGDKSSAAKIRTLMVANDVKATFKNIQFFGARNMNSAKSSVVINQAEDVVFEDCLFAQENVSEAGMRPIETYYGFTGKLTLKNCTVEPGTSNAYFNPLAEGGELTITGTTFKQIVTIDPKVSSTAKMGTYKIEDNVFEGSVAVTALSGATDVDELSADEKSYVNNILANNTFGDDTQKVKIFSGSNSFYVNDLSSVIYNQTTGEVYNSVQNALNEAQPNEVVLVSGATCAEELIIPAGVILDGSDNSVFTGKLHAAQGSTIRNLASEWAGTENRQAIEVQGADVTLQNISLTYKGTSSRSEAIVSYPSAKNLTVENCQFNSYWKGLYLNTSEGVDIKGCTFNNMNPFSTDEWNATLNFAGNTITGNIPTFNAAHCIVVAGTAGMDGTTKYQESWPLALKESVYSILNGNAYTDQENPYMRVTYGIPAIWDYSSIYFCINDFLKGNLANAQNAFTQKDRFDPSAVDFLPTFEGKDNVLRYTLDNRTSQANRPNGQQGHFYNTQGRHFNIFNPQNLTQWEVSGEIWVDATMIASTKPFRSELWTSSKNASTGEAVYPMLGITNVTEDANGTYQSTMDHAVVRTWGDDGWTVAEGIAVNTGWHTVKMVSDGNYVTYYFDGQEIGKMSATAAPVCITSIMPQAFHYDYQENGNYFYEGYTCETYFCNINYQLKK